MHVPVDMRGMRAEEGDDLTAELQGGRSVGRGECRRGGAEVGGGSAE